VDSGLRLEIPGEQLVDEGGRGWIEVQLSGITRMLGIESVAERSATPGQQLACSQTGETTAPHPVTDEGALILGDRSTNRQQQLVVWVLTHGPLEEFDTAAAPVQLLDEQDLVHRLAGESIRRGHHHAGELGQRRPVAQRVQTWSRPGRLRLAPL
jgi:hypothetical protein